MSALSFLRIFSLLGTCLLAQHGQAMTLAPNQYNVAVLKVSGVIESVSPATSTLVIRYTDTAGLSQKATLLVPDTGLLNSPLNQPFRFVAEKQSGNWVLIAILPPR